MMTISQKWMTTMRIMIAIQSPMTTIQIMTVGMKKKKKKKKKKKLHITTIMMQKHLYTTSQECHYQQKTEASERWNLMMYMTPTQAIGNTDEDAHSDTNTNTLEDAEAQQLELPTTEDPSLLETTYIIEPTEQTTEPTNPTTEPIIEPSYAPTYIPTATDVEIAPREPAQEQEGDNEEEDEEH
eukprot:3064174-Ditylum_brightwellii.AAC.1